MQPLIISFKLPADGSLAFWPQTCADWLAGQSTGPSPGALHIDRTIVTDNASNLYAEVSDPRLLVFELKKIAGTVPFTITPLPCRL